MLKLRKRIVTQFVLAMCIHTLNVCVYVHIHVSNIISEVTLYTPRNAIKRNKNVTSAVSPLDSKIDSRNFSPREYSQRDNI